MIALGCAGCLAIVHSPSLRAEPAALRPLADEAPSLPLTPTFEKMAESDNGPYVLSLKNISKDAVTASAQIVPSVAFHANAKVRNLPDHVIDPGQVWTIPELAAGDKVTITAKGFAPLELTVP